MIIQLAAIKKQTTAATVGQKIYRIEKMRTWQQRSEEIRHGKYCIVHK